MFVALFSERETDRDRRTDGWMDRPSYNACKVDILGQFGRLYDEFGAFRLFSLS